MASARLKKKASEKFLSPEQTRTIKPADFKNHMKVIYNSFVKVSDS